MERREAIKAEIEQLPSGFWAIFIDGNFVDISSPSKEVAQEKLEQFLQAGATSKKQKKRHKS